MLYRHTVGRCFFPQWASPAAAGDVAYVARFDGVLHALRASDGKRLWTYYVGDSQHAGSISPGELAPSGGCDWEVPVGYAAYSPIAVARDGTILVGTHEGYLYAIGDSRP
jgi:outer membrane protein assembly factor BamB